MVIARSSLQVRVLPFPVGGTLYMGYLPQARKGKTPRAGKLATGNARLPSTPFDRRVRSNDVATNRRGDTLRHGDVAQMAEQLFPSPLFAPLGPQADGYRF